MALTFTKDDLEILNAAIASGVRRVKYTDKEVTYHSLAEMLELRNLMQRELGLAATSARILGTHSKGLC